MTAQVQADAARQELSGICVRVVGRALDVNPDLERGAMSPILVAVIDPHEVGALELFVNIALHLRLRHIFSRQPRPTMVGLPL
jgi:hypothetical protein